LFISTKKNELLVRHSIKKLKEEEEELSKKKTFEMINVFYMTIMVSKGKREMRGRGTFLQQWLELLVERLRGSRRERMAVGQEIRLVKFITLVYNKFK